MSPNRTFQTLTLCLTASTAISGAALVQINFDLLAVVGGLVADDNGNGIIDRAEPADVYGVGGANNVFFGSREFQGSYEFNLRDPSLMAIGSGGIVSVLLTIERTGVAGAAGSSPSFPGEVGGYIGDGLFDTGDSRLGRRLGTFMVYSHRDTPWPHPDSKIDVTSFFVSLRDGGFDYIGFNLRPVSIPNGTSVDNWFHAPRLEITALIPEPSTAGLAALGVLALALRRGRG